MHIIQFLIDELIRPAFFPVKRQLPDFMFFIFNFTEV